MFTVTTAKSSSSLTVKIRSIKDCFFLFSLLAIKLIARVVRHKYFFCPKVTCVGHVIGAVLADNHEHAQRAAKLVKIKYEELQPVIITIEVSKLVISYVNLESYFYKVNFCDINYNMNLGSYFSKVNFCDINLGRYFF